MAGDREAGASLVRSETRIEILERLAEGGATRYDLRAELDCSRTTVDRNLDRLEEAGWVESAAEGYAITTPGAFVLESALEYVETVGAATRLQPILRHVPRWALDVDLRHLADAEMTVAGEVTPLAMVDRHVAAIERFSAFRAILPITSAQPYEVQYEQVLAGELTVDIVVTESIAEVFLTGPQFAEKTAELLDHEQFSVAVTDEPVPYYLGVLDGTVQLGVDEDGEPRGLLETDDDTVREWAEETIDRYMQAAVPIQEWRRGREFGQDATGS